MQSTHKALGNLFTAKLQMKILSLCKYRYEEQPKEAHDFENRTLADRLFNEVKILCWIMTNPSNHEKKAKPVLNTWGSRCNKLLIMSSAKGL